MRLIIGIVSVLSFSVAAQDLTQSFTSTRSGLIFQPTGPDVFRGPPSITPIHVNGGTGTDRRWSNSTGIPVGTLQGAFIVDSSTQVARGFDIPSPGNPDYDQFIIDNAASPFPISYEPISAVLSSNLAFTSEPSTLVLRFVPPSGFVGNKVETVTYTSNGNVYATVSITFSVANAKPTGACSVSPSTTKVGVPVQLFSNASDADGHALTYLWSFGDGNSSAEKEPVHIYSSSGKYTVTVVVNDGFESFTSATLVDVASTDRIPTARFTTSDIVAFVGQPFNFDAANSTDPQNAIAAYIWEFGDESPVGTGQLISKIYNSPGAYTVMLTVRDAEGLTAITSRSIEVLPADQIGLFNAFIEFKTTFDRTKAAKDSITLKARLNVGDSQIIEGNEVALEIAGQRFSATLDRRLRASVRAAPKQTWKVQFGTRKQTSGQVDIQITIKNANLGLGFNQLGAVVGDDDSATVTILVHLEVGGKTLEIPCEADFEFKKDGKKATGEGSSD